MKFNIYILVLVWVLAVEGIQAQDLIKNAQLGQTPSIEYAEPNAIAKQFSENVGKTELKTINLFTEHTKDFSNEHSEVLNHAVYLKLNPFLLKGFFGGLHDFLQLEIPVGNEKKVILELMKVQIFTDDFTVQLSDGESLSEENFNGLYYRGIVKGDPTSLVAISIFEDAIRGFIVDQNGNYILGALEDDPETYIFYNDRELKVSNDFNCGVDENLYQYKKEENDVIETSSGSECIEVYIETDFYTYTQHSSNIINVQNYVTALFNEVSILYANESIDIYLSELFIWTSIDPYASLSSTFDVLKAFGHQIQNNYNGRLAHLITQRQLGGGIAWVDVLCQTYLSSGAGPYALSANLGSVIVPFPTYSWDIMVFAHEMGHNIGSPHTHDCAWSPNNSAIDGCAGGTSGGCPDPGIPSAGGTIMSYCHLQSVGINFNLGFGPQPGALLRNKVANATCILTCCPEFKILTAPITGPVDHEVNDYIIANNMVSGAPVDYDAGNYIRLIPGFHAQNGCIFNAFIDGCGGLRLTNPGNNDDPVGNVNFEKENAPEYRSTIWKKGFSSRSYPNPFSNNTNIEFILPEAAEVSLSVYNANGILIRNLMSKEHFDPGKHSILFEGSDLDPGIYIYKLKVGREFLAGRMVLLK